MLRDVMYHWLADRLAPQIDAYTWHRYSMVAPFLIHGPIDALNIGTGGGIETLRLLDCGNHVTTIEYDRGNADRTRDRVIRSGYAERHVGLYGHILNVELDKTFHLILMSEVLEHVMDDAGALRRLAGWLKPGGRLILSTPTASHGQLPGDTLSVVEDGGHVRVGYDGPELDAMLAQVGLVTQKRVFGCGAAVAAQLTFERVVRARSSRVVGPALGLVSRPLMGALDLVPLRPTDQITLATKLPTAGSAAS